MKWIEAKNRILKFIDDKNIKPGEKLPTDKEFAEMFGMSLQPIIKAMQYLELHRQVGRGTGRYTVFLAREPIVLDSISFSKHAVEDYKVKLDTKLLELAKRKPLIVDEYIDEKNVQKTLGLKPKDPFIVVVRLRFIDDQPKVIHRAYLNPSHFPEDFLIHHNFEKESLIDIYNSYGYDIIQRNTKIRARFPNEEEKKWFKVEQEPVLSSFQTLTAIKKETDQECILECMYGTYLKWEFSIENRL